MTLAYLPSPSQGVWHLGPIPIRAYAMCILLGIVVAVVWTGRRWEARGGRREDVVDVAIWAVPFGLVGGRLYHVITDPELYFTSGRGSGQGVLHLGRRARDLGRGRAGGGRRVDRVPP